MFFPPPDRVERSRSAVQQTGKCHLWAAPGLFDEAILRPQLRVSHAVGDRAAAGRKVEQHWHNNVQLQIGSGPQFISKLGTSTSVPPAVVPSESSKA